MQNQRGILVFGNFEVAAFAEILANQGWAVAGKGGAFRIHHRHRSDSRHDVAE